MAGVMRLVARGARMLFLMCGLLMAGAAVAQAAPAIVAKTGDASLTVDAEARTSALAAGGATLVLSVDTDTAFQVVGLVTSSGRAWASTAQADTVLNINGQALEFGRIADGFVYVGASNAVSGSTLRFDVVYDLPSASLRVTRHYAVVSGSPVFEVWTTFEPLAGMPAPVSTINGFRLTVPNGTVRYLTGLQGDNADVERDTAFSLQTRSLNNGEHFTLGAQGRSSETTVPWLAIDGSPDEFFAGLMWSGAWSLSIDRKDTSLTVSMGLATMITQPDTARIEGPHAVFGVVRGSVTQATSALRGFIQQGLRGGRALSPLVTYNTWFAYGVRFDEATLKSEMDRASALGAELFVVDAGWYAGVGRIGAYDFDSGLGSWQVDRARFPSGLAALTTYAHAKGMKFGIWVEPERVDLAMVGQSGLAQEAWLAQSNGKYGSNAAAGAVKAAQVCFASAAARQWVTSQLTALIDSAKPDYLKWDNNMWVNCNRSGHSHGASDGNFAHVTGLYQVLAGLRAKYPSLLVENVSGGGNRLDLGMMRYSDVAWMDDRTAPAVHVRHNVQGLSAVFPPAYLLSFVLNNAAEPLQGSPDLSLYFRSRMQGALGLCFRTDALSGGDTAAIRTELGIYKANRPTLSQSAGVLLTKQAAAANGPSWDVLQESSSTGKQFLIHAVQFDRAVTKVNVKPTGLTSTTTYEVRSVDAGLLATTTGAVIAASGIDILASPVTAAHIITITAK